MSEAASNTSDWLRKVAALLGASGVALGAIGAHAFKDTLTKRGSLANWQTATMYQLFHATALLGLAAHSSNDAVTMKGSGNASSSSSLHIATAGKMLASGTVLFSGSIYCLCLGIGPKAVLGPTTPVGGLLMIGGWIVTAIGDTTS